MTDFGAMKSRAAALLLAALAAMPAAAVDMITPAAPDLTKARAAIKAKEYQAAITELATMVNQGTRHPDVFSLLGFSYRKTADYKQARTFYAKALEFDPDHKGALEYQGEMFLELGEVDKAKGNLARLVRLCPAGCEERGDLEEAFQKRGVVF